MNFSLKTEKSLYLDYKPKLVGWKEKKKKVVKTKETPVSLFLKQARNELPSFYYKQLQIIIKKITTEIDNSAHLRLLEQAIELCALKSDLVYALNNFAPENYVISIQRRGIVVRLCEGDYGQNHFRSEHLKFIKKIKNKLSPLTFNLVIEQLDKLAKPEIQCRICAVEKLISLLASFKDLALELNEFLPSEYVVRKVGKGTFIFTHPPRKGSGVTTDYYADSCHTDLHYE